MADILNCGGSSKKMDPLERDIVFLVLQFLDERNYMETMHKLEEESGLFFNMSYFEDTVRDGKWEEAEKYLLGFTKVEENRYSLKIFFEIRKTKYLEALDQGDRARAVDILIKDLKVFSNHNEDVYKKLTQIITLRNFREHDKLSNVGDLKLVRSLWLDWIKKRFEENPLFHDKLQFPTFKDSRLRTLIDQSIKWQHVCCNNGEPHPNFIETLFVDHSCGASTSDIGKGAGDVQEGAGGKGEAAGSSGRNF